MMTPALTLVVLAVAGVVIALWLSWTAGRLDRMHVRCEGAAAALDAALAERRALVVEVAAHPSTDPASAVLLLDAATAGRSFQHESDLSAVLRAVRPDVPADALWDAITEAGQRVRLARRIHNDLVATTLALRGRRRVRWFRLAGHAPAPPMIAFDDRTDDAGPGQYRSPGRDGGHP
jgi:hypothetical protein